MHEFFGFQYPTCTVLRVDDLFVPCLTRTIIWPWRVDTLCVGPATWAWCTLVLICIALGPDPASFTYAASHVVACGRPWATVTQIGTRSAPMVLVALCIINRNIITHASGHVIISWRPWVAITLTGTGFAEEIANHPVMKWRGSIQP